jgi:hypothetical protein
VEEWVNTADTIVNSPEPVSVGGEVTLGVTKSGSGQGVAWMLVAALLSLPMLIGTGWAYARRRAREYR